MRPARVLSSRRVFTTLCPARHIEFARRRSLDRTRFYVPNRHVGHARAYTNGNVGSPRDRADRTTCLLFRKKNTTEIKITRVFGPAVVPVRPLRRVRPGARTSIDGHAAPRRTHATTTSAAGEDFAGPDGRKMFTRRDRRVEGRRGTAKYASAGFTINT